MKKDHPLILAPAGNQNAFLAAIAAGADAVYCGLKHFSARMAAENFTPAELARLVALAHKRGVKVNVALNTLLKPNELDQAAGLMQTLAHDVQPDALIVQDLGMVELAGQADFKGEIHLSTLAAVTTAGALDMIRQKLKVDCVVLPRELNIDEIKQVAAACPKGLRLEVFVHGALCYGVSGRCYWSSYMGGKSGLRGRCVQPCRRQYTVSGKTSRLFSCLDFSVDVLVKTLLDVPAVSAWKIEGRKKGPHYVYYTTMGYKLLRDHGNDPKMKKIALSYLENALGRPTTHYNFLPQRSFAAANTGDQTGSGMLVGRVKGGGTNSAISPRIDLLKGDLLRIGYEDQSGHRTHKAPTFIPAHGRLHLQLPGGKQPMKGSPVFLIDRLEEALKEKIADLSAALEKYPLPDMRTAEKRARLPKVEVADQPVREVVVQRSVASKKTRGREQGLWLEPSLIDSAGRRDLSRYWWWLPPVIWPAEEDQWRDLIEQLMMKKNARRFVLNAPWQMSFFPRRAGLDLWAGPFCNQANPLSIKILAGMGFAGVMVSPELAATDYVLLAKHSPLPLGAVVSGYWPFCVARVSPADFKTGRPFASPRGETAWMEKHGDLLWVYPNWPLDLSDQQAKLKKIGYRMIVHLSEPRPPEVPLKRRPGVWNWDIGLT